MQDYLRHLSKIRLDYTVFYLSRSGVEFLGGGGVGGGGQGRGLPLCFSDQFSYLNRFNPT